MKTLISISTLLFLIVSTSGDSIGQLSTDQFTFCTSNFEGTTAQGVLITSSIGQPFFTTLSGTTVGLTQGFQQPGYLNCPGDFDNNGVINVTDLLIFNTVFSSNNLNSDMNGDGFVGVTDLIIFITLIGTSCSL
jgi:hypothetical protein